MTVLASYSDLTSSIGTWAKRTYSSSDTDEFIRLTEAKADRKLKSDFRRRTSTTITTDASGLATLPTGFVGMTSLVRNLTGSVALKQVAWDGLIERNPYEDADDAIVYAINGTQLRVSPVTEDDFIAKFSSVLTGLSGTNTTNWLLALAPDYYLFGCLAAAAARLEAYDRAALLQSQADDILDQLVSQGNVAEYGNAEMTLPYYAVA